MKVYALEANVEEINGKWKDDMKKAKKNLIKVTNEFEKQVHQLKKES